MIAASATLKMFADAQRYPWTGADGKDAKCTRSLLYSEIIDAVALDGVWVLSDIPWGDQFQ
eukprot:4256881-Alexandrium_andersonii.AAC.1